jgi:hypothetical protein
MEPHDRREKSPPSPRHYATPKSGERSAKDGPWCWANKSALEKIRTRCEDPRSTLAVYLALCEIASDEQSNNFMASMDRIAAKACLSRRTVFDRLNDLERIGLVEIFRSKTSQNFRIPSAYVLLKCEIAN